MKIFDLSFGKKERNTDKNKWGLYHGVKDVFSSLRCTIGTRDLFISTSKHFQEEMDKSKEIPCFLELGIVPLYRNCLIDTAERTKYEGVAVRVLTDESEIATIKLENCNLVTPIVTDKPIADKCKETAFIVAVDPADITSYRIRIYRLDGKVITIDNEGFTETKVSHKVRKPNKRLSSPSMIIVPTKTFITDDVKEKREGYISVNIYDIIYKFNKLVQVIGNRDYIISSKLSDDNIMKAKAALVGEVEVV